MLQSYDQEIHEKKRAARYFWLIVFIFSFFLYFFFQGYYPSIRLSLEILGSGSGSKPRDIIQSFGIVNVSALPLDSQIIFESGSYSNDEKKMVPYGKYSMQISHDGYLPVSIEFPIEKNSDFFIEKMQLLPLITYKKWGGIGKSISKIDSNTWIGFSSGSTYQYDTAFSGEIRIGSGSYTPIGEGYFLSGINLYRHDIDQGIWNRYTWSGSNEFMSTCPEQIYIKQGYIICTSKKTLLRNNGSSMTRVVQVGIGYIFTDDGIYLEGSRKPTLLTGSLVDSRKFVKYKNNWYGNSGSLLIPLLSGKGDIFDTGFSKLEYIENKDNILVLIGYSGSTRLLSLFEGRDGEKRIDIPFPDRELQDIRIERWHGNYFIKTRNSLLFAYHNSKKLEWIIDGDIIAFSEDHAIYRTGGTLWKASWELDEEN